MPLNMKTDSIINGETRVPTKNHALSFAWPVMAVVISMAAGLMNLVALFFPWMGTTVNGQPLDELGGVRWGEWPADRTAFDLSAPIAIVLASGCIAAIALLATRSSSRGISTTKSDRSLVVIGGANVAFSFVLVYLLAENPLGVLTSSQAAVVSWEPLVAFWAAVICSSVIALYGAAAMIRSRT